MKKTALLMACVIVLLVSYLILISKKENNSDPQKEYLKKLLSNLEQIKSATYYSTSSGSAPGDTTSFTMPRTRFIKMFINPADTMVGSKQLFT